MYWNDEKLTVEPYRQIKKQYYCGRELLKFPDTKMVIYTILVIDYSECYCANVYSDGEVRKVFEETSFIDNKTRQGGQSAPRYERIRRGQIKKWFKNINQWMKGVDSEDIVLGISNVYYSAFKKHLDTYNTQKIKRQRSTGYSGLSGVYDMVNFLEREKNGK